MTTEELRKKQAAMSNAALIGFAEKQISELARSGGNSHKMCVPPEITDTDMLFSELIRRFKESNLVMISECDHGYKGPNKHDRSCKLYCGMKREDYEKRQTK